jgi:Ran GTPase-activating protein (RanGAP) involved in mRNA processing and transport
VLRVNGGLTSIDLSGNRVCGIWTDYSGQHGTYTAEGITAIAYALRINGALTECDLIGNYMGEEGKASIRNAVQGKDGFKYL